MLYLVSIGLIFLASYILILKDFKLSLYILIVLSVLLHKELFSFYRWDLMPVRVFMLALLCSGITKIYFYVVKERGIKSLLSYFKDPYILFLLVIWFTRGLSIIFSKNIQASLLLFGFFTTVVALGIYLYLTFKDTPDELIKYLRFFTYVVFGLSLFGFIQLVYFYQTQRVIGAMWPVPGRIPRVGSLFWDVNHYGALLAATIPIMGIFLFTDKNLKSKVLNVFMILSSSASLLLTNSRTAWMVMAFAVLFFATILMIKKFGSKGLVYIFLAIVLVSTPFLIEYNKKKSNFRRYVRDAFHYRIDSFDSHFMLLTGTYQIFEKYPYLGGGYGSFFEHFSKTKIAPEFFTRDTAALSNRVPAHTIWGESLSETGIIGTVPYVLFSLFVLITPLYVFFKGKDKNNRFIGGVFSSVVFGWYMAGIFYSYNAEFFWIMMFSFFIWGIGNVGKEWFKEVSGYFFKNSKILLSLIILLSLGLLFISLGKNHLIPWDEAIYAKVAKNMVVRNEYIIPYWDNFITGWFEKPPLYMWMMSGFMNILGFNSWSARLPSAIFGFLTVLLVYFMGKKLFNKTTAFISALALTTTVHFLYYSRASMLDVTATFFITLSLYLYWLAKQNEKNILWILSGASVGLAVMTKGFVGLLPFLVIGLYEIYLFIFYKQKVNRRLIYKYLFMFLPFLLVALPWHLTMYQLFGKSFLDKYFFYHVWDRATSVIEDKGNPFFWYVIVIKVSMRIWFVALLGALPFSVFHAFKKDRKHVFLSIWAISIFLFFSIAKSKLVWYIIPVYPVLCLIVGNFSERVLDFIVTKIKFLNSASFKFLSLYLLLSFSLFYLFLNKSLVYTPDLNGPQAKLLMLKDEFFGIEREVYLDRMEMPTPLFYSDGPFVATDVNVVNPERVPRVSKTEPLIFISKKSRFRENVPGYSNPSKQVKEYDPWLLWYVPPEDGVFDLENL
ncbi:glycosyltransferase family 39 protein [Patescibacteria group bacterium]|nr:glycosyltransferase family 39 protein [Patescibacteria group bacterium]